MSAPRPPIGFRFDVPDHWTVLDLDPDSSSGWVDWFVAAHAADLPASAFERSRVGDLLRRMIEQHRQAGVLFAAFLAAARATSAEALVAAGVALAWQELAGMDVAGLERFCQQDAAAPGEDLAAREVCRLRLRHGEAVRVRSRQLVPEPLTHTRRPVAIVQHLVLIPDNWLGVFSLTTPQLDRAVEYAELADRVARSLVLLDDSGQPLPEYTP